MHYVLHSSFDTENKTKNKCVGILWSLWSSGVAVYLVIHKTVCLKTGISIKSVVDQYKSKHSVKPIKSIIPTNAFISSNVIYFPIITITSNHFPINICLRKSLKIIFWVWVKAFFESSKKLWIQQFNKTEIPALF